MIGGRIACDDPRMINDLRLALRRLARHPGLTVAAILASQ
jgi:hypothetical protein